MTERLPLFPLGTVLFPGLVLPLHVFEERYRALVRHLTRDEATGRTFGVVAIRLGRETGSGAAVVDAGERGAVVGDAGERGAAVADAAERGPADITLHQVGCTAEIRQMTSHPDGRFDLVTVGRRRFRIHELFPDDEPFLQADVEWISEPEADQRAERLVPGLLQLFQRYLELIRTDGHHGTEQLPDDPAVLSYLIGATTVLALDDRQDLLAADTIADRLALERRLLNRELVLLREINALPVPLGDLAVAYSDN
ncbi:MAG TPA: LON peptidase substrate-binding domain-containing protein [Micromonosporaceae bacterium]|jgi:hypothetical protein|nr:LON peptidase substrate-binding domain-containing protein [Micromonosporaceae bacterium]